MKGDAPILVALTDTLTAPNGLTAWAWSFGDGITSTLQHPTHQYPAVGVYTVGLTINSDLETSHLARPSYITVTNPVSAQFTTTRCLARSR